MTKTTKYKKPLEVMSRLVKGEVITVDEYDNWDLVNDDRENSYSFFIKDGDLYCRHDIKISLGLLPLFKEDDE
jgi:hypothetical protein